MSGEVGADSPLITAEQAAALIHRHHETVLLYCKRKMVKAVKLGGKWLIDKPSLLALASTDLPVEKRKRGRPRKAA